MNFIYLAEHLARERRRVASRRVQMSANVYGWNETTCTIIRQAIFQGLERIEILLGRCKAESGWRNQQNGGLFYRNDFLIGIFSVLFFLFFLVFLLDLSYVGIRFKSALRGGDWIFIEAWQLLLYFFENCCRIRII